MGDLNGKETKDQRKWAERLDNLVHISCHSLPIVPLGPLYPSLGVNLLGHNGNSQDGRMKVLVSPSALRPRNN